MSENNKKEHTKDDIRKTTRLNKKYILIGIPIILSLLIIGSFFFKIKTPGKVISGGSWTHYSQLMKPDGSIDYNQEEELIVVCTVEYTTWYGSTYTLRYNRGVRMPYSQMDFFSSGDLVEIEYNPLFPNLAQLEGLPLIGGKTHKQS